MDIESSFWSLFDGAEFYRLKRNYCTEFFAKASAVVLKNELICQLETSEQRIDLSESELAKLADESEFRELKAQALKGTLGVFAIMPKYPSEPESSAQVLYIKRLGLRYFTDTLAEHRARLESGYAMDLVGAKQIAQWVSTFAIGLALTIVGLQGWWLLGALLLEITAFITTILVQIQALGHAAQAKALQMVTYKTTTSTMLTLTRNAKAQGRKALQNGANEVFQGYSAYANQPRYLSQTPGSQTYTPTQAYTPSEHQTPTKTIDKPNAHLKELDEITQGRAHYELGGNVGYTENISKEIPLASIKELENDKAYRINQLNNQSRDLYQALAQISQYTGSTEQYSSADYLQEVYNTNFEPKERAYHSYMQSKDCIELARLYNYALRFNRLPYSIALESKELSTKEALELSKPYDSITPNPPHYDPNTQNPESQTPMPPAKRQEMLIKQELEAQLRAQGLSGEKISQLVWGSESESASEQKEREIYYIKAKIKHLKALDPSKALKAIKAYDLLQNYAKPIAQADKDLRASIASDLQEHYTQGFKEHLAHQIYLESSEYQASINTHALSVWVEFRMKPAFKDYFYRATQGVSPRILIELESKEKTYYLKYTIQLQKYLWAFSHKDPPREQDELAWELWQAQLRVYSNFETTLWKVTREHLHANICAYQNTQALEPLYSYLHDQSACYIYQNALAKEIQALQAALESTALESTATPNTEQDSTAQESTQAESSAPDLA